VPVPPPMPLVTKTISAPLSNALISSADSSAAFWPISGLPPAPSPLVILSPMRRRCGALDSIKCLSIRIDRYKLDPLDAFLDHAIDGVRATATYSQAL
jgi:hypothetical protein